jgi:hypothetical protein
VRASGGAVAGALATILAVVSSPGIVRAQDKVACAAAYEKAQTERQQGHLRASHEQLRVCSQAACSVLQKECITWLGEVEAALPSVVVEATGPDARDALDVQVACDGAPLLSRLDGKAVSIDPGLHSCRFEMGGAVREEQIVLHEGERNRPWRISFGPAVTHTDPVAPEDSAHGSPIPVWAWVLGGVGVVAIGVGASFEVHGLAEKKDLDQCKGNCQQSAVDATHASFVTGDVAIGIGFAAVAVAAIVVLTHPHGAPADASLRLRPFAGVGGAMWEGRF